MGTFSSLREHLKKKHENASDSYGFFARPLSASLCEPKLIEIEEEIDQALIKIRRSEPGLQRKIFLKLKTEIINKTDELRMSEDRRSYLLHQVANSHDIDNLVSLIREINCLQINQHQSSRQDLISIAYC